MEDRGADLFSEILNCQTGAETNKYRIKNAKERIYKMFERVDYVVARLDGDYAYLIKLGEENAEEKCVARGLLPPEINEGSRLAYEMMEYTVIS